MGKNVTGLNCQPILNTQVCLCQVYVIVNYDSVLLYRRLPVCDNQGNTFSMLRLACLQGTVYQK